MWVSEQTISCQESKVLDALQYDLASPCVVQCGMLWFSAPKRHNSAHFDPKGAQQKFQFFQGQESEHLRVKIWKKRDKVSRHYMRQRLCESAEIGVNLRNQSNVREPRRKHDDPFSKRLDSFFVPRTVQVWREPGLKPVIIRVGRCEGKNEDP